MFKVRALNRFIGAHEGQVERGTTFETNRDRAYELAKGGNVEILEGDGTPPGLERHEGGDPSTSGTQTAPSSFSPPASQSSGSTSPPAGAGQSSASTTVIASGPSAKAPTGQTTRGGKNTTKKSERPAKATDGVRTAKRAGTLISDGSNPTAPPASLANPDVSVPAPSGIAAPKP